MIPRVSSRGRPQHSDNTETMDILAMAVAGANDMDIAEVAAANGFEDISNDSNSSFDQSEFESVYGPPSDWGCGRCGLAVQDTEEGIQCDGPCRAWVHAQCGRVSPASYRRMVREEERGRHCQWLCPGTLIAVLVLFVEYSFTRKKHIIIGHCYVARLIVFNSLRYCHDFFRV